MIVRAGSLDQGNIILNLADADRRGITDKVLFLAGSAINSIKNAKGKPDPALGRAGHDPGAGNHRSGELRDVSVNKHLSALCALAKGRKLAALRTAPCASVTQN